MAERKSFSEEDDFGASSTHSGTVGLLMVVVNVASIWFTLTLLDWEIRRSFTLIE